jgi:GNAT superfamily N-acetyltransferase
MKTPSTLRPADFTLRLAEARDIATILQLLQLKADFDHYPKPLQVSADDLQRDLFGTAPKSHVLLVEQQETYVGFASYHTIYSTFLAKPGLWLDDLYLKPEARRQGIGRAIMQYLHNLAQAQGCARIDWLVSTQNLDGIAFYESIGATIQTNRQLCRLEIQN